MEKAKKMILETNYTITDISARLGFKYPQYFGRFFKNRNGNTPSDFKKISACDKLMF